MRTAIGLRWERALALLAAILLMLVVALSVVGALPVQAAESGAYDDAAAPVAEKALEAPTSSYYYGGGGFLPSRATFSTWGNSWG